MHLRWLAIALLMTVLTPAGWAQDLLNPTNAYKILSTTKVGGAGGWDHVYADSAGRRLYVPRTGTGAAARIAVYDLDTMKPVGTIAGVNAQLVVAHPARVSPAGFFSQAMVEMSDDDFDAQLSGSNQFIEPKQQRNGVPTPSRISTLAPSPNEWSRGSSSPRRAAGRLLRRW